MAQLNKMKIPVPFMCTIYIYWLLIGHLLFFIRKQNLGQKLLSILEWIILTWKKYVVTVSVHHHCLFLWYLFWKRKFPCSAMSTYKVYIVVYFLTYLLLVLQTLIWHSLTQTVSTESCLSCVSIVSNVSVCSSNSSWLLNNWCIMECTFESLSLMEKINSSRLFCIPSSISWLTYHSY